MAPAAPSPRTEWWAGEERPPPALLRPRPAPPLGSGRIVWESSRIFLFTRPQWPPLVLPLVPAPQGAGEEGLWRRWSAGGRKAARPATL